MKKSEIIPRFLMPLAVQPLKDGTWQLVAQLQYESKVLGRIITVPAGFKTDFASVPRWPLVFWLTGNTAHEAATIHDYLYKTHESTRYKADETFAEAMRVTGMPMWRCSVMYVAVRLKGSRAYKTGPERLARDKQA